MEDRDEIIAKLREDLRQNDMGAAGACEGCGAILFDGDNFHSEDVQGCWPWVTGFHENTKSDPCYKYRVPEMSCKRVEVEFEAQEIARGSRVDKYITPEIAKRLAPSAPTDQT